MRTVESLEEAVDLLLERGCGAYVGHGRCGTAVNAKTITTGNADTYPYLHTSVVLRFEWFSDGTLRPCVVAILCPAHQRGGLKADMAPDLLERANARSAAYKRPPVLDADGGYHWA